MTEPEPKAAAWKPHTLDYSHHDQDNILYRCEHYVVAVSDDWTAAGRTPPRP